MKQLLYDLLLVLIVALLVYGAARAMTNAVHEAELNELSVEMMR